MNSPTFPKAQRNLKFDILEIWVSLSPYRLIRIFMEGVKKYGYFILRLFGFFFFIHSPTQHRFTKQLLCIRPWNEEKHTRSLWWWQWFHSSQGAVSMFPNILQRYSCSSNPLPGYGFWEPYILCSNRILGIVRNILDTHYTGKTHYSYSR